MATNGVPSPTDAPEAARVVGVRFRQAGKIYYFDPGDGDFEPGDRVLVEAEDGLEVGEVAIRPKVVPTALVVLPLRAVVRPLSEEDNGHLRRQRETERSALQLAFERAQACGLDIKFVSAELAFDESRLRLFFVSEERVDFRQLVRDLSSRLRARIELRQIGVRDQAKMVGGIGDCGRELCCTTWMGDFEPVSIRMAKLQNLSLNPSRLSGQCGRLKCCLKFENEMYRELLKDLPKVGTMVHTSQGTGKVIEVLTLKESVLVDLGDGRRIVVKAADLLDAPPEVEAPVTEEMPLPEPAPPDPLPEPGETGGEEPEAPPAPKPAGSGRKRGSRSGGAGRRGRGPSAAGRPKAGSPAAKGGQQAAAAAEGSAAAAAGAADGAARAGHGGASTPSRRRRRRPRKEARAPKVEG